MTSADTLPGLPGADDDPGQGAASLVLFERLLADAPELDGSAGTLLERHRAHRAGPHAELLGPLVLPAGALAAVAPELATADHGLPVVLTAWGPGALDALRIGRDLLLADDHAELVGVRIALGQEYEPAAAVDDLLDRLDFSVPAWIGLDPGEGWEAALDLIADDGAENVLLIPGAAGDRTRSQDGSEDGSGQESWPPDVEGTAGLLRRAVDRDVTLALGRGLWPAVTEGENLGLLNMLCAVRAALNGALVAELATILASRVEAPLLAATRRMSDADAAVVRSFLATADVRDLAGTVDRLQALGLLG